MPPDNGQRQKVNEYKGNCVCALGRIRTCDTRFRKPALCLGAVGRPNRGSNASAAELTPTRVEVG